METTEEVLRRVMPELLPEALNNVTGVFYNGSEIPVEKSLMRGLEDMSKNVFVQGRSIAVISERLEKAETETNENSELLSSERQKKAAVKSLIQLVRSLSWWQKAIFALLVVHYAEMFFQSAAGAAILNDVVTIFSRVL